MCYMLPKKKNLLDVKVKKKKKNGKVCIDVSLWAPLFSSHVSFFSCLAAETHNLTSPLLFLADVSYRETEEEMF